MKTIEDLVPKLLIKTNEGSLRWKETQSSETYEAEMKNNSIRIWEWEDQNDGSEGITIAVMKGTEVLDSIYYDKYAIQYERFRLLYAAARRSALSLDKVYDALDDELDDL